MHKSQLLLLFLAFLAFTACDRKAQDSATVTITLPEFSSKVIAANYTPMSDSNSDDDELPWSNVMPDGISGTAGISYPINCYALMVEGAEQTMRVNTCGRKNTTTGVIETTQFGFKVGMWVGAFPGDTAGSAQPITMEVPAGLARIFRLVGFYVANPIDCVSLNKEVPRDKLSRPYVIAQSTPIDLTPGEKEIPLVVNFDSQKWFDDCDFGGTSNSSPVIATKIQIRKDSFPVNKFVKDSSGVRCQAVEFQLTDSSYRPARLPDGITLINYRLVDNGTSILTYSNKADCKNSTADSDSFDVLAGTSQPIRRWIRIPANYASTGWELEILENSRVPSGAPGVIQAEGARTFEIKDTTSNFYDMIAPIRGYKNQKYIVEVYSRYYDGNTFMTGTGLSLSPMASTAADFYFYDYSSSCSNTPQTSFTMGAHSKKLCFQYSNTEGATADYISPIITRFESRSGSTEPYRLRVQGTNQISVPATGSNCVGPFVISLENEYGVAVNNTTTDPFTLSYSYNSGSPVQDAVAPNPIVLNSGASLSAILTCTQAWTHVSSPQITPSEYKTYFYISVPNNATLGYRKLDLTATLKSGRQIKGSFQFSVDEAD